MINGATSDDDDVVTRKSSGVGLCLILAQLCARCSSLRRWHRLTRFGAPHYRLRRWKLVMGSCQPKPTSGRRFAGIGELFESLEANDALGHAGCPAGGLFEQALRATTPFLSVDFPPLTWRRSWIQRSVKKIQDVWSDTNAEMGRLLRFYEKLSGFFARRSAVNIRTRSWR